MTVTLDDVQVDQGRVDGMRAQLTRLRTQRRAYAALEHSTPDAAAATLARMDAEIVDLEVALGETVPVEPDALAVLRLARGPLALRIADGDEAARGELADVEARIAESEERAELDLLAAVERQRVEHEAAQEELRAERERLTAELDDKRERRAAALREFQSAILQAAELVPEFRALDDEVHDLGVRLGSPVPSLREIAVELSAIHLVDAGLTSPNSELLQVRASTRQRLLQDWPPDAAPGEAGRAASVPQCSVCTHDDREEIESDLAAGVSLREVAERYSVSRSALSRHGKHAGNGTLE